MQNLSEVYRKWIDFKIVTLKKWYFFKEEKFSFDNKLYTKDEFYDSITVLFSVVSKIERTGYDISIFSDEVRIEPNLGYLYYVPPVKILIKNTDCKNNIYNKMEALSIALIRFNDQYLAFIENKNLNVSYR